MSNLTATDTKKIATIAAAAIGIVSLNDAYKQAVMGFALDMLKADFLPAYLEKTGSMESPFAVACYMAIQNAAIASLPDGERKEVCLMDLRGMNPAQKAMRKTVMSGTVRPKVGHIALAMALATPDLADSAKLIKKAEKARIARKNKEANRRAEIKVKALATVEELEKLKTKTKTETVEVLPRAPHHKTETETKTKTKTETVDKVLPYWVSSRNNVVSVINGLKQKGKGMTAADKDYATALKLATDTYDKAIKAKS